MEIRKYIYPSNKSAQDILVRYLYMLMSLAVFGTVAGYFGKFFWFIDLAAHFRIQMAVFFVVMLPLCIYMRRRFLILLSVLCLLANAIPVLLLLLPFASDVAIKGEKIRVLFCNVNSSLGNPDEVLACIEKENPDIVVLEEISLSWLGALKKLEAEYLFYKIKDREDNFGIAMYTRIEGSAFETLYSGCVELPSIKAVIPFGESSLTLIGTHPPPPISSLYSLLRNAQLLELAKNAIETKGPFMLLGDFNSTPWSNHFAEILDESGLQNSSQGRGIFVTWPTFFPLLWIPIDHCLHSDEIVILDKHIGQNVGSDHYPVIVDFALSKLSATVEK